MRVFISHACEDWEFVGRLMRGLTAAGIEVWHQAATTTGRRDNPIEMVEAGVARCDAFVAVVSPAYSKAEWSSTEAVAFASYDVKRRGGLLIPLLVRDAPIPSLLRDFQAIDFRRDFDMGLAALVDALRRGDHIATPSAARQVTPARNAAPNRYNVARLQEHLRSGELALVCGAGVSLPAGIPTWPALLRSLLVDLFGRHPTTRNTDTGENLADLYENCFSPSPLMMAQYLRNGLGDDFLPRVRDILYRAAPSGCDLVDAIVELCRPQRSRSSLRSIITFNFDDLIEQNLMKAHVRFCSIHADGQKAKVDELPIYHVHGFLPSGVDPTEANDIVFSEDAYHSQFIDPFSWANLIQLSHYSQYVCLFVGLSMTDPNLRRLLDVAMRKNPEKEVVHYLLKRRYDWSQFVDEGTPGPRERDASHDSLLRVAEALEETDAQKLGMNVVWLDDYSDTPGLLREIAAD